MFRLLKVTNIRHFAFCLVTGLIKPFLPTETLWESALMYNLTWHDIFNLVLRVHWTLPAAAHRLQLDMRTDTYPTSLVLGRASQTPGTLCGSESNPCWSENTRVVAPDLQWRHVSDSALLCLVNDQMWDLQSLSLSISIYILRVYAWGTIQVTYAGMTSLSGSHLLVQR